MATLTHIDTACALVELGGWRLVTDPVFDAPGRRYHFGWGATSRKSSVPALSVDAVGAIDAVLLSHHQHGDNLDPSGRRFTASAPRVLTTRAAARTLPGADGLAPWDTRTLTHDGRAPLVITATPAQHRPGWIPEFISGPVVGFVLETPDLKGDLYISGDTVLFDGVREVARRRKIDTAILHVGAVRFPWLTGPARYTFDAREAVETARLLDARRIVALHTGGWTHFREGPTELRAAFEAAGLADRLVVPVPGEAVTI